MLEDFSPAQVAWLRYFSAFAFFFAWVCLKSGIKGVLFFPKQTKERLWIVLMGLLTYCYSPLLQITGLKASQVSENALMIAIEPILTVVLALVLFQEKVKFLEFIGLMLSLLGFVLLSDLIHEMQTQSFSPHLMGNVLILCSLLGEASFSVFGSQLSRKYSSVVIFGTSLALGLGFLTVYLSWMEKEVFQVFYWSALFEKFSVRSFIALLWLGPLGTAGGYLYALKALSQASVSSVALLLFVQPLVGALLGSIFYGERFSEAQWMGGCLMILSLGLSVGVSLENRASERK